MGGVCTGGTARSRVEIHHESPSGSSKKMESVESIGKQKKDESFSYPDVGAFRGTPNLYDSGELYMSISRELKPSTPARTGVNKVPSSFLGKASIVGLEKAVEVLDTLGSSMTNLNSGGFMTGMTSRGNKIAILAFEVANTITKGANLLQSLSKENVEYLKKEILPSKGVQQLVSTNMKELLTIAAADKREEFDIFSREVIRFGDMCKDPQWHNLNRYFSRETQPLGTSAQTDKDYKEPPPAPLFEPGELSSWSFYRAGIADGYSRDCLAFGGMIFALVYCTAGISGGHINPAVTLGLFLARKLSLTRSVFYIVMQCLGDNLWCWCCEGLHATDAKRNARDSHVPILAPLPIGFAVFLVHLATIPITGTGINPARSLGAAIIFNDKHAWRDHWIFWVGPIIGAILAAAYHQIIIRAMPFRRS
ncbi:hypothetical protein KY285_025227 [Solanum tuberosum]|nr:hypothetical protein KY285_025227 [Solanum tuberosum]